MSAIEFIEHFPYCVSPEAGRVERVCAFGTPGEVVALSFSIRSAQDIDQVEVTASSLCAGENVIHASHIDVYVVKVWDVSGFGIFQTQTASHPELLLKDDREPLVDGYVEHIQQGAGSVRPLWHYRAPDVRMSGNVCTSLFENEAKQVWLSIKIPSGTPAAHYHGCVEVSSSDGETRRLELELEVLPFTLAEATQDLMIWYRGSIDPRQSQFYVSSEMFRKQLQDIYDHGFRSISICERDRAIAQQAIDIAEGVGFDGNIVFRVIPINAEALNFQKLTPVIYLSDELDVGLQNPHGLQTSSVDEHRGHGAYCEILNWSSMASIKDLKFLCRMDNESDIGCRPTIVSLDLDSNRESFVDGSLADTIKESRTYISWRSHMEKPNLHRLLAGYLLWKIGAAGISPYCYQHVPAFPFSPFNDFDAWEPEFYSERFRDQMTTYPARAGVIPTLQWEGLREGITDLRYLHTLELALSDVIRLQRQEANLLAAEVRNRRDAFLDRITIASVNINSATNTEPLDSIRPNEYHEFRRQIANDIVELKTCLAMPSLD